METGIFIRVQINDKWGCYDIGDKRLDDVQVLKWMRECFSEQGKEFYERLALMLLNRNTNIATLGVVA